MLAMAALTVPYRTLMLIWHPAQACDAQVTLFLKDSPLVFGFPTKERTKEERTISVHALFTLERACFLLIFWFFVILFFLTFFIALRTSTFSYK